MPRSPKTGPAEPQSPPSIPIITIITERTAIRTGSERTPRHRAELLTCAGAHGQDGDRQGETEARGELRHARGGNVAPCTAPGRTTAVAGTEDGSWHEPQPQGFGEGGTGGSASPKVPRKVPGELHSSLGAASSHLSQHEAATGAHGPRVSPSPSPSGAAALRPGPPRAPGFVWEEAAAAAGLGPLAGYCRRIYCIAARAGCSPAHNRLAVAQGSTLRGKEGGTHSDADCRAFAAVYCRIRPPGPPPPRSQLCQERGRRGPTRPPPASPPPPNPMHPRRIPTGCPRCPCPSPVPSEGVCRGSGGAAVPQVPPMCCWGRRAPPLLGATAQSWCRAGAGGCKQH